MLCALCGWYVGCSRCTRSVRARTHTHTRNLSLLITLCLTSGNTIVATLEEMYTLRTRARARTHTHTHTHLDAALGVEGLTQLEQELQVRLEPAGLGERLHDRYM